MDCLLSRLLRVASKKSKLHVTGLCEENSPVTDEFPAQRASNVENVSIWWRHHANNDNISKTKQSITNRQQILWEIQMSAQYRANMGVPRQTDKPIDRQTFEQGKERNRQTITWTNIHLLSAGPLEVNLSEILFYMIFIKWNTIENVFCTILAILVRSLCVESIRRLHGDHQAINNTVKSLI